MKSEASNLPPDSLAEPSGGRKMSRMGALGRTILILGAILALLGIVLIVGEKLGLGRLPGDIVIERKGFRFSAPIATSILLSLVLTLLANLIFRR